MLPYAQVSRLAGRPYGGLNLPKQPGLDGRHRDVNGQIHQKRGDTRIGTLRKEYGVDFAGGARSDMRLDTYRAKTWKTSIDEIRSQ